MAKFSLLFGLLGVVSAFGGEFLSLRSGNDSVCWKDSIGRGAGHVIHACRDGEEKSGALCYPVCKQDTPTYKGVGPVCWQDCKDGYVDEGALCRKKGSIKTYAKKSYGRGAGRVMTCAHGEEEDGGLCYKPCNDGYYGVGPVCWESCSGKDPSDGGAICCKDATTCTDKIKSLCEGLPKAVAKAILAGTDVKEIVKAAMDAINAVLGFVMPKCSDLSSLSSQEL